jgi:hypothetical protein
MAINPIDTKLIDTLLTGYKKPEDIVGKNGLLKQLTKGCFRASDAGRTDRACGL